MKIKQQAIGLQFKFHTECLTLAGTHIQPIAVGIEQREPTPTILDTHSLGIGLGVLKHPVLDLKREPLVALHEMDMDVARLIGVTAHLRNVLQM